MSYEVDESLRAGLRYTEEVCPGEWHGPYRRCCLWVGGGREPVSSLRLVSLEARFGAIAVAAEGYAGVQTPAEHRGKGYAGQTLERSLAGVRRRVRVAFLFGIEYLYSSLGYTTCLPGTSLSVRVRHAEGAPAGGHEVSPLTPEELPAAMELFNAEHGFRPWTVVRRPELAARLTRAGVWRPSPVLLAARRQGELRGYAALGGSSFGLPLRSFSVLEMTAADDASAQALIGVSARASWEKRIDTFSIMEPQDGTVGTAARRMGCEVRQEYVPDGEGMGIILGRAGLLDALAPELARREACAESGEVHRTAEGLRLATSSSAALAALIVGDLVPDDRDLLRLLLGYWSLVDAEQAGMTVPPGSRRLLGRWFPGPSPWLPQPHAHQFDRY